MGTKEIIDRETEGGTFLMGSDNNNSELWYQKDDGSWGRLAEITSVSIDLTDEAVAALSSALVPLGELEIVPRGK